MPSQYILRSEELRGVTVDDAVPLEESNDAFMAMGSDNTLLDCFTIDSRCRTSAHCDHIQIIPTGLEPNAQYFGAIAHNNRIIGGGLDSNGSMQGIFGSDGCQKDLYIADQTINTESEHQITLNGVLSGTFLNNKDQDGNPVKITLEPLRIGGGLPDAFYVLSFKDHEYEPINTDQEIQDNRSSKLSRYPDANYVYDFDLNLYRDISEGLADQYTSIPQQFKAVNEVYKRETAIQYPPIGKTTKRKITDISVHCSATKEGIDITTSDIRRWHVQDNGWSDIGYHYIIRLDGTIEKGRPLYKSPAAVRGHNKNMIAVVYIGGIDENQVAKDTRTPAQKASMDYLIGELKRHYPEATVKGHRSYPNVAKACPSFDATEEYR